MGGIFFYYLYLLLFWGFVRRYVSLPEVIEELWLKPIIWLVPLMLWNFSAKKRIVVFESKNWITSVVFGLAVGVFYIFALSGFSLAKINLDINYIGIAMSVAMVEELVFSGIIFGGLSSQFKSSVKAVLVTSIMAAVSHLPMMLFVYSMGVSAIIPSLLFVFGYSLVNVSIRASTKNVLGSIVARLLLILAIA